jgi:hypothetical protein
MLMGLALSLTLLAEPTIILGTGARMCEALAAADFAAVGLAPDPTPRPPNSDDKTNAYCGYTKAFPVAGGLELDIFDGEADPRDVVKTILAESGTRTPASLPGVDEAVFTESPGNKGVTVASIVVRHRRLVFAISVPSTARAREQLAALAQRVLSRVKH